jgi:FMN-dependent NADH-azoreductase
MRIKIGIKCNVLKFAFEFVGLSDVTYSRADRLNLGDGYREKFLAKVEATLHAATKVW